MGDSLPMCDYQRALMLRILPLPEKDPACQCLACLGYPAEKDKVRVPENFGGPCACPGCGALLHGTLTFYKGAVVGHAPFSV